VSTASRHAFRARRRTLRAVTRGLAGTLCQVFVLSFFVPIFLKKKICGGNKKGGLWRAVSGARRLRGYSPPTTARPGPQA